MEIKNCKRCGEPWCFHGTGRPIRCGKCKSPYWDRERVNASRDEDSGRQVQSEGRGQGAPVERREEQGRVLSLVPSANDPVEGSGAGEGGDAEAVATCRSCEGSLRNMSGKLVCCVIGCSMQGLEQGRPKR